MLNTGAACLQEGENLTALLVWIDKEPLKGSVLFVVRPLHSCPHSTASAASVWASSACLPSPRRSC